MTMPETSLNEVASRQEKEIQSRVTISVICLIACLLNFIIICLFNMFYQDKLVFVDYFVMFICVLSLCIVRRVTLKIVSDPVIRHYVTVMNRQGKHFYTYRLFNIIIQPIGVLETLLFKCFKNMLKCFKFILWISFLYLVWGVVLFFLCYTTSDFYASQYQHLFVSNFSFESRSPSIWPSLDSHSFMNKVCSKTETFDISAFQTRNTLTYKIESETCYCATDIENTAMENVRMELKSPGEFVNLRCTITNVQFTASLHNLTVVWKKDNRLIHVDDQNMKINTSITTNAEYITIESYLIISYIDEGDYGRYMCQVVTKAFLGECIINRTLRIPSEILTVTYTNLYSQQILKKYSGIQDVIFVPLGNELHLFWYPLTLAIEGNSKNIQQTYSINGKETQKMPRGASCSGCSYLTRMFSICGGLRHWFIVPLRCSLMENIFHIDHGHIVSVFSMCADTSVYGIHKIVFRRLKYDKEKKRFVNVTVEHPDTYVVLPEMPYAYQLDNYSNSEKVNKVMLHLKHGNLTRDAILDDSHVVSLNKRYYFETIAVLIAPLVIYMLFLHRNKISDLLRWKIPLELSENRYRYTCYVFCCDEDKTDVTSQLYNKLLEDNMEVGIILNNCELNNPGRKNSEITSDIIDNSLSLIFFISPSYLADTYCKNYHLIPVMENMKTRKILANKVLFVMVNHAKLPKNIGFDTQSVSKVKWRTSNSHSAYNQVKNWIPVEVLRFPERCLMGEYALIKRGEII
ncbi:uncharacterized protein LOC125654039 [Ostrea edulis]|uniref:uncharacterized protein LOC125654039 n=1 Tax=Ostrea edulis TaxID=37623 RepID=UPI0024AF95E5|nr:uncharacterized protein LOC125654039 [Ostrea edulis]